MSSSSSAANSSQGWRLWFSIFGTTFGLGVVILTVIEGDAFAAACFGSLLGVNSVLLARRWSQR